MPERPGTMIDLIMGYECNVRCDYCSIFDELRPKNMSTAQILAELQRAWAQGIHRAAFGGGEPTIRKDFLPLVRWCRDRGFDHVKVASNGMMYSYEDYARKAVDAGVTQFNISAMGHTEALYNRIMATPKALGLVRKGVDNLIALGQEPALDLIVKADTWRRIPDTVAWWADQGVKTFSLWLVSLTDRNAQFPESMPRVSEMREGFTGAFDIARERGLKVTTRHVPRCMLRGYEDHVEDVSTQDVLIVTPGERFHITDSVISPNALTDKCEGCRFAGDPCIGMRRDYLERYGDDEIEPYFDDTAGAATA
ncbi:MAG: radical SAM protein [Myxococcota bacterium]